MDGWCTRKEWQIIACVSLIPSACVSFFNQTEIATKKDHKMGARMVICDSLNQWALNEVPEPNYSDYCNRTPKYAITRSTPIVIFLTHTLFARVLFILNIKSWIFIFPFLSCSKIHIILLNFNCVHSSIQHQHEGDFKWSGSICFLVFNSRDNIDDEDNVRNQSLRKAFWSTTKTNGKI